MTVQPFTINVAQSTLDDLQRRLARTRWADEVEGVHWDYGTNKDYLKSLVEYWQNGFDWREQEAKLNQFAHFRTEVDGVGIHFIHEKGKGPNPTPIILTHGWPDSFIRMLKIIPMLTDPARFGGDPNESFDVIVPSVPGYGFSDRSLKRGMTSKRVADLWAGLMDQLGYKRYAAAAGDLGSVITMYLGQYHPEKLIGIHLTDVSYPMSPPEGVEYDADAQRYFDGLQSWWMSEGAYNMLHSTKPQTTAYALSDSPVGLAAWLVEKFRAWSDCDGDVETRFTKDELLTNITIYWATETINSAMRLYYEQDEAPLYPGPRIEVPAGIAHFKTELLPPRSWIDQAMNVQRWTKMPRGGHFAALEEPALMAEELRTFYRGLRK